MMQILYVKYNRERYAKYQIKTTIQSNSIAEECGDTIVVKSALTNEAEDHIQMIFSNYDLLRKNYQRDVLAKPISYKKGEITFEYIKGESFETLLLKAVQANDRNEFERIIFSFKEFLYTIAGDNYCNYEHIPDGNKAIDVGKKLEGLKCFTISNIDLNLDNIMLNEHGEIKVIDYEWVYPFPIPINFIMFRAFNSFYYSHYLIMQHFISFDSLLAWSEISLTEVNEYISMSQKFASLVGTDNEKANLHKYLKKIIRPSYVEPADHKAQIFINEGQGFSEQNSSYFSLSESSNILRLNLTEYKNIIQLRFDPLQGKGTVQIKKVVLKTAEGITYKPITDHSNSILNLEDYYIFDQDDPQIYYKIDSQYYDSLEIEMIYFDYIPYELIVKVDEHHRSLLNSKSTVEQNWQAIQTEKRLLKQELEKCKLYLEKEQQQNLDWDSKYQQKEKEFKEVSQLLEEKKHEISYIMNTKWWKTRTFIRRFLRKR